MAKSIVDSGVGPVLGTDAPMPDVEPGHRGYTGTGKSKVFDPNAALRYEQGVGPGLQDSEINSPAHWTPVEVKTGEALVEREIQELERQLEAARSELKRIKSGQTPAEAAAASSPSA